MGFVYSLEPKRMVYALLVGEFRHSLVPENNHVFWSLHFYDSEKTRATAAKKRKRTSDSEINFITWEFTLEDIIRQGKWILVRASEKVLFADKMDIFKQIKKFHSTGD
jgi:hypothetical protein